jgi:hypothetical protein
VRVESAPLADALQTATGSRNARATLRGDSPMQCTLLIPCLFWPKESAEAATSGLTVPALGTLLGRSRAERFEAIPIEGWLCQAFQVERQQDWPAAPFTLAIDGGEVGDAYWLRADPVHLEVERDRLRMIGSALFDLDADETQSFVSALNTHFASTAISFHAPAPKRWYVRVERSPKLVTHCASEVAGQDVQRFLPSGPDAREWHGIFNEVQMLLHAHVVNAAREERGEPVVNSVWFWGGGVQAPVHGRPYDQVWSDDVLATALAISGDVPALRRPADATAWLTLPDTEATGDSSHLIVLDDLAAASAQQDGTLWRERVAALEKEWFAPLVRALRERRISRLALVVPGQTGCWRFDLRHRDLLKFWRHAKSWTEYA